MAEEVFFMKYLVQFLSVGFINIFYDIDAKRLDFADNIP